MIDRVHPLSQPRDKAQMEIPELTEKKYKS